jgi:hypothetical protein
VPRVKQLAPPLTEKEAEIVELVLSREISRVRSPDYEIIDVDPFAGYPPSVRRRLVDRLINAHAKVEREIAQARSVPAIATTPVADSDVVTSVA